jgi:nucleoside phosphorylase
MRVLVTFAVDAEFAPWRRSRKFVETHHGLCPIYSAKFAECSVDVVLTGIGGKSDWLATIKRVCDGDVDICISSGLAGALRPDYRIGQVLAAKVVHSTGWSRTTPADRSLLRRAVATGAKEVGSFYSADHIVLSASEKRELGKRSDAVEMESGEVLYEAAAFGARVIAVRGISDSAEENLPLDFNRVTTQTGQVSLPRVFGEVAMHLSAVPALIRFGQQSRMAAEKLAEFLERYIQTLAGECTALATEVVS